MADLTVRDVTLAAPCRAKADTCRIIVPVTALLPQPAAALARTAAAAGDLVELRLDALADQSPAGLAWAVQTVRRAIGETPLTVERCVLHRRFAGTVRRGRGGHRPAGRGIFGRGGRLRPAAGRRP